MVGMVTQEMPNSVNRLYELVHGKINIPLCRARPGNFLAFPHSNHLRTSWYVLNYSVCTVSARYDVKTPVNWLVNRLIGRDQAFKLVLLTHLVAQQINTYGKRWSSEMEIFFLCWRF
jgi:hypothetical protein